jgi:hypothetical protein
MPPVAPRKFLLGAFAGVLVLGIAGAYLYGAKKKLDLESSAAASVADATTRLRDAAGLALGAPQAAARLTAHAEAMQAHLEVLRAEDASRNKALAEAAELYLLDVQAIARNRSNAARAHGAARASMRALAAHLEQAAERGTGWIQRALALKERAERDNYDLRASLGALAGLVDAHRESQEKLKAAAPDAPLLADEERLALLKATRAAETQAGEELERLRRLPVG